MKRWFAAGIVLLAASFARADSPREKPKGPDTAKPAEAPWVGKTVDARGIAVTILFDTTDAPDLKDWAAKAGQTCADWYPKIDKLLASDGFSPPKSVEIRFRNDYRGLAMTIGNTITIQPDWVRKHPDDVGMLIHELSHVVQSYAHRGHKPGWLVEGIADYIRIVKFEPNAPRPRLNPDRAKYTEAYKTAAMFLEWAEAEHDPKLVNKLNAALRNGTFKDDLWQETTGRNLDDLWSDYMDSLRKKAKAANAEK